MTAQTSSALHKAPESTPEREAFYAKIEQNQLKPLWTNLRGLSKFEPESQGLPMTWRYQDIRPLLFESVPLISVEEAERRVLNLANPGYAPFPKITNSLMAGLQLVLPGEIAPAHRHTPAALRFVVEGSGAYTAVDGEKTEMKTGDFVITPGWTWHDHGNETDTPMVWLDVLDVPIVSMLDAGFTEVYPEDRQITGRPSGDSLARYGSGLLPVNYTREKLTSPIFNYPYARTREALETMRRVEEWDACHGLKLQFVNPVNGDFAMPTLGVFMQLLPKGFTGAPYRSTDGTVFSPIEGKGRTIVTGVDGKEVVLEWGAKDFFVVPAWMWHRHEADDDAVLFSASDRATQQKLGLWREMRGNQPG